MKWFDVFFIVCVSFYIYNIKEEIDVFIDGFKLIKEYFGLW